MLMPIFWSIIWKTHPHTPSFRCGGQGVHWVFDFESPSWHPLAERVRPAAREPGISNLGASGTGGSTKRLPVLNCITETATCSREQEMPEQQCPDLREDQELD